MVKKEFINKLWVIIFMWGGIIVWLWGIITHDWMISSIGLFALIYSVLLRSSIIEEKIDKESSSVKQGGVNLMNAGR